MIGIVLAGGAATRLPNKILLPMRDGEPVIMSGIDYLYRHGCEEIRVVLPPNSPVVDIVETLRDDSAGVAYVYQAEATGVGDAIRLACPEHEPAMIVMGDNVYPENETFESPGMSCVAVRPVPAWRMPHLVRWSDRMGAFTRGGAFGRMALTTPWVLGNGWQNEIAPGEAWRGLNRYRRVEMPAQGWWDIGTPELYAAYWRDNS